MEDRRQPESQLSDILGREIFTSTLNGNDVMTFGDIENMSRILSQLDVLSEENSAIKVLALKQHMYISSALDKLRSGKFFSSIDDVWDTIEESSINTRAGAFNRANNVERIVIDTRYETTAAVDITAYTVTSAEGRSNVSVVGETKIDVFGFADGSSQSAHLMPQSKDCSTMWYPFVPWVLNTGKILAEMAEYEKWKYMQCCIHGFTKRIITGGKKGPKIASVGVKHFPSNRIHLNSQEEFLDKKHCVFIIPILSAEEVKTWNGEAYNAIVLAGKTDTRQAARVYQKIGACEGQLLFASREECKVACDLLQEMIGCICRSLPNTFSQDFLANQPTKINNAIERQNILESVGNLRERAELVVPQSKDWTNKDIIVRKVSFSEYGDPTIKTSDSDLFQNPDARIYYKHAAPDPALLCGKAACNWFKRCNVTLLPGCDDSIDSEEFVASRNCS